MQPKNNDNCLVMCNGNGIKPCFKQINHKFFVKTTKIEGFTIPKNQHQDQTQGSIKKKKNRNQRFILNSRTRQHWFQQGL
jgi:hypothetical protein